MALMALGGALGPVLVARDAAALCVAGVALGDIYVRFTWQAWHHLTFTLVLRGRRGTHGTGWRAWARLRAWRRGTLRGRRGTWWHPPSFHVAGVAPSHIHLRFAWQAWHHLWQTLFHTPLCHTPSFTDHLSHPTLSPTIFHAPSFTHHFVTHHLWHTIFHTQLCHTHHLSHTTLSHTIFDTPSFTHHLCNTPSFTQHLLHPTLSNIIFDTPCFTHHFVTHHFVTHHLSPHHLPHTIFHHTILHTQLCHTPSFTTPSSTHHLSPHHPSHTTLSHTIFRHTIFHTPLCHTTLSHALFHTQLSHTPSFTHCFVTHTQNLSSSHTIFHIPLCHTHNCFNFSILHRLLSLSFLPSSCYNLWCSLLEEVDLWGYPVL